MAGGKEENTLHANAIGWGILLAVFAVLLWLFWFYYDYEVRSLVRWIRYGEMWIMSWFLPDDFTVTMGGKEILWHKGFEYAPQYPKTALTYTHLAYFGALAMQPLKYVFMGLFLIGAIWSQIKGPGTDHRTKMSIDSLISRQKHNFPVISPLASFDPSTQPPRPPGSPVPAELPAFAEALGPEEWLAYNEIPAPDGKIDERAATRSFQKQLIGRWKGPKALKPYQQILLAAFCLKASRKRNEADVMLGKLASCWTYKKGLQLDPKLLKEARKVLGNKKLASIVLTNTNRHAFVTTALLRALATAREEGGVLASAQFVWLRAYDRTLWYPLNNLGRQSFHMEALGAMSHYRAEKMTQRPIPVPKLEDAVTTISGYMTSAKARPIPTLDYSQSKKRGIKKAV